MSDSNTDQVTAKGDPRFLEILEEMRAMHIKKTTDYGNVKRSDPLANLRASARFGVEPWVAAILRLNDKLTRVQSFIENGSLANEPLEDSFRDMAAYAILALILFREHQSTKGPGAAEASLRELMKARADVATAVRRPLTNEDAHRMFDGKKF